MTRRFLLVFITVFIVGFACAAVPKTHAAITVDASSSANCTSCASLSYGITVTSTNSNNFLFVGMAIYGGGVTINASSVTYAGVPMTRAATTTNPGDTSSVEEIWYLKAPPAGSSSVVITPAAAPSSLVAGAVSLLGVNQTTPIRGFAASSTASGTGVTSTITSAVNDLVIDVACSGNTTSFATPGTGQTKTFLKAVDSSTGCNNAAGSTKAGASTVSMNWTGGSDQWLDLAVSLEPAPAPVLRAHFRASGSTHPSTPVIKIRASGMSVGSVVYDNATNGVCGDTGEPTPCTGGTTLTFSHTTGSGSNRAIAVGCSVSGSAASVQANISTVTYAGASLSQLAKRDANYDTYIWTLPNGTQPAAGPHNVVVTMASTGFNTLDCVALTASGVDQTNTWSVSDCTGAGSGATASCTLSSNSAGSLVVVAECNGTSIGSPSATITNRASHNNGAGACMSFGMGTAPGGTTNISWDNNGSDTWQILAAAFKAASNGGSVVKFR